MHASAVAVLLERYCNILPRADVVAMLLVIDLTYNEAETVIASGVARGVFVDHDDALWLASDRRVDGVAYLTDASVLS